MNGVYAIILLCSNLGTTYVSLTKQQKFKLGNYKFLFKKIL